MKENNIIVDKSYAFAIRIVKLHKYLIEKTKDYHIAKQVFRSGTSAGANIEEAIGAQSTKDFIAKLSIAYKEARETHYWIRLLRDTGYLEPKLALSLLEDSEEIKKIISAILITTKKKSPKNYLIFLFVTLFI